MYICHFAHFVQRTALTAPYGDCIQDMTSYSGPLQLTGNYTSNRCRAACEVNYYLEKCGCIHPYQKFYFRKLNIHNCIRKKKMTIICSINRSIFCLYLPQCLYPGPSRSGKMVFFQVSESWVGIQSRRWLVVHLIPGVLIDLFLSAAE